MSPSPLMTPRVLRSMSLSRFCSATVDRSVSSSLATIATYQSTSPSSASSTALRSGVISPASSRIAFLSLPATSPASDAMPRTV